MELKIKGTEIWGIKNSSIGINGCFSCVGKNEELYFSSGFNLLIGEYHDCSWAIPYLISHKGEVFYHYNDKMHKKCKFDTTTEFKKIYNIKNHMKYTFDYVSLNQNEVDIEDILSLSSYIGEKKYRIEKNLGYYIKKGCKKSKINFDDFINASGETIEYFNNQLKVIHHERLYYHSLIAISEGKKILCYPWIQSFKHFDLEEKINNLNNIAQYYDCILLIPLLDEKKIKLPFNYRTFHK